MFVANSILHAVTANIAQAAQVSLTAADTLANVSSLSAVTDENTAADAGIVTENDCCG